MIVRMNDTQDSQHPGYNKLASFCDVFRLSNSVRIKTCFTKSHSSSIDVILTNKPRSFLKTSVFETGLSDCHGLVITLMKAVVARLKPKIIKYRGYKTFYPKKFLQDVKKAPFEYHTNSPAETYDNITSTFRNLVEKHAPLKSKFREETQRLL